MKLRGLMVLAFLSVSSVVLGQMTATTSAPAEEASVGEYLAVAEAVAPSLVRVEYTLQHDKGDAPKNCGWAERCPNCGRFHSVNLENYISEERPLEMAGFLLEPTRVLAPDLIIHPRFVKGIAVRFGDQTVSAKIVGYAKGQKGIFLQLAEPFKQAKPLGFDSARKPPYLAVSYNLNNGVWAITVKPMSLSATVIENGRKFVATPSDALIVDSTGGPVGVTMKDEISPDDSWKGSPLRWPTYTAAEMDGLLKSIQEKADRGLLRVTLGFRSPRKGNTGFFGRFRGGDDGDATEQHVTGIVLDEKNILVLAELKPNLTARLERIIINTPDGKTVPAKFAATLVDYGGFLATVESPLPGAINISGDDIREKNNQLLMAADIILQGEKRVTYFNHNRIAEFNLGWKRRSYPVLPGGSVFLFDDEGHLLAFPISKREKAAEDDGYGSGRSFRRSYGSDGPTLTPARFVKEAVADLAKNSDASNVPLSEKEEARLAWMGVVLQPLNQELARANNVSDLTNDGQTGALVSYVYPDSPAAKTDIKAGVILLRLHAEGQPKPLEVRVEEDGYGRGSFPWDKLDSVPEEYYDRIPTPWPSAENQFTRMLTNIGFGKKFVAEFFTNGQTVKKDFTVEQSPAYYDSAPRYKSPALGLTVRDMTYEVRRYLQKEKDAPGVIVSKIEPGGKAAVAGIRPFEVVTQINGTPVKDVKDFERLVQGDEDKKLSILRMTRGRQVNISMKGATTKPKTPAP